MLQDKFVGSVGNVEDNQFGELIDYLEANGKLVYEEENAAGVIGTVIQFYAVDEDGRGQQEKIYRLQYQVRTPRTPEHVHYMYEFSDATNVPHPLP